MKSNLSIVRTLAATLIILCSHGSEAHAAVQAITFDLGPDNVFTVADATAQGMAVSPSTYGTLGRFNSGSLLCFGPYDDLSGAARPSGLFNIDPAGSYSTPKPFPAGTLIDGTTGLTGWGVISANDSTRGLTNGTYNLGFKTSTGNFGWMNVTLNENGTPKTVADDIITINAAYVETVVGQGITISSLIVTTAADSGPGSLRQTISNAPAGTTIIFAANLSGQTIILGSSLILSNNVTIDASSLPNGLTVDGGPGTNRLFSLGSGQTLTLVALTLTGGDVGNGQGGAIFGDYGSTLSLSRCTLTGHHALEGGAIFCFGALTLENCTLSGNSGGYGGAVQCLGQPSRITHCTIAGNTAGNGGGIYNKNTTLNLANSIVAGNTAGNGPDVVNENAALAYAGANIVQSVLNLGTGSVSGPAALNTDPLLAPLANYGGPTQTMPPLRGSPAIDAGGATALTTDQRGYLRLLGAGPDIGAVEINWPDNSPAGNALVFNGVNQYVSVPNFGAIMPMSELTVEFWAYANAYGQQSAFVLQPDDTTNRFNASISASDGSTRWDFGNMNGGGRLSITNPPNSLTNWVHYALVASQSGNYMRIYVNGQLYANQTNMTPFVPGSYELRIGGGPGFPFHGKIDEFRIWKTARTQAQILANRGRKLTGDELISGSLNLVLYYPFDSVGGTVITNRAPTGPFYNGVAVNNPTLENAGESFASGVGGASEAYTFTTFAGPVGSEAGDGVGSQAHFGSPAGVAVDGNGNVYVADLGSQTIRKITAAGVVTTLAGLPGVYGTNDGTGSAARFFRPYDVAVDKSGSNVYVADFNNFAIRKITADGLVTTLAGLAGVSGTNDGTGSDARFYGPIALAVDNSGNVYAADLGVHSTIRKITPAGVVTTLPSVFPAPFFPYGVAVDNAGNLYVAAGGQNALFKITAAGVVTTLASGFDYPTGVAVDTNGNVYVANTDKHTIRKITAAGLVTTLAGLAGTAGSTDGASSARFNQPRGVAVDNDGNVYVADSFNDTIRKITSAGLVTTLAGQANPFGSTDATGRDARFHQPFGVAVDNSGNVYVADSANHTIRKITSASLVTTLAGLAGDSDTNNGTGSDARFNRPSGVAVDNAGNVYVADTQNNTIRKITAAGVVTTLASGFNGPTGVAVDTNGNVYVADTQNNTIRKITSAGVVTTLAGQAGQFCLFGDDPRCSRDGTGSDARFNSPNGVAVDSAGNVYVADYGNSTIRKITSAGVVTTLAGLTFVVGSADGTGSDARFFYPGGIGVDSAGNLYVADSGNNTIRKGAFNQYAGANAIAYVQPAMNASLTVTLLPAEANGQWRFPWELGWRDSGVTVSNLVEGNYPIEFRDAPGYLALPLEPVQVTSGANTTLTNQYYPTISAAGSNSGPGSLTVYLGPTPPSGAGWRFLGESGTNFFATGFTTNLSAGIYLIEFVFVNGRVKPPSQAVRVSPGLSSSLSVNYLLAAVPPTNVQLPFPVPGNLLGDQTTFPFGFNGQLQSDNGYGSGVAVEKNVVLTAAHLVFSDQTLSYVSRAHWFFRRDAGVSEPLPQAARSFFLLTGYAAQRTNDLQSGYSPDQSTPPSRNVDVAALYFPEAVAGGGHGGYLPSDAVPNTWLSSTALKMLVGYPVDGSQFGTNVVPGRMYQTDPQPYPLILAPDSVPGQQQQVYEAPWFLSHPGNSGGPLYVQLNGYYYPAAVYLGTRFSGSQPVSSLVRAIDSAVVNLITNAAALGESGTNFTGGGIIQVAAGLTISSPGLLQVVLGPSNAVAAGGGWRLVQAVGTNFFNDNSAIYFVNSGTNYALTFRDVPGFVTPTNRPIQIVSLKTNVTTVNYVASAPAVPALLSFNPLAGLTVAGSTGATYRVDFATNLLATNTVWTPLSTQTLSGSSVTVTNLGPPTNKARYFRAVLVP